MFSDTIENFVFGYFFSIVAKLLFVGVKVPNITLKSNKTILKLGD